MLVLTTAAGGSTGGNGARGRHAEFNEIACISDFKMLTVASETSIYARTAEINCHILMHRLFCGSQFKQAEVK